MSVLTKLMDAQLSSASSSLKPEMERRMASKKRAPLADSAVRQMRKIKRIEKRFSAEEKRLRMIQSIKQKQNLPADHVPGKKLPIWKKRANLAETSPVPIVQQNGSQQQQQRQIVLTPVDQPPPGAVVVPLSGVPSGFLPVSAPLQPKAYGRPLAQGDRPKLPRQIREIQENLTFEKIRRTGTRNVTTAVTDSEEPKEMSVEELREFMAEQRKRLQAIGDDDDADDYFDNDAGLDYDDDHGDDDEDESPQVQLPMTSSKPILKAPEQHLHTPESGVSHTPRKSVRFSLRPGSISTPSQIENPPVESAAKEIVAAGMDSSDLDSTADEFNKEIEEEEEQRSQVSRSGRPIIKRLLPEVKPDIKRRAEKSSPVASPPSKRSKNKAPSCDNSIDLPPPPQEAVSVSFSSEQSFLPSSKNESESPAPVDHSEMVAEVLRTYPDLFKDNKQVKLKVTTKDAQGRAVTQLITLRQQERTESADASASTAGGLKNVAKVKYTGGRGRPKKIKPGEADPHENERKAIEERLQQQSRIVADTAESEKEPGAAEPDFICVAEPVPINSILSSATTEADFAAAESLMHIQSAGDQSQLNGSDYLEKQAVVVQFGAGGEVSLAASDDVAAAHSLHVLHAAAIVEEGVASVVPETSQDQAREGQENSSSKGVSKLAADWDEDEDADGRDAG
jgi:hypothetical protein